MGLPFKRASELKDAPPTMWAIKPFVAYGAITELVGEAKAAGKSTFVQWMIRSYLDGTTFLGEPCSKGPVLILTEEGSVTLREAFGLAGLLRSDLYTLQWPDVWSKPWSSLMHELINEIKELGPKLIIVDTLPQFCPDSESDVESALRALRPLRRLTHEGYAIVIIRHERKLGGRVGKAGRGTTAIPGGVDILLQLRRRSPKEPNTRTLDTLSRFRLTLEQNIIELTEMGYKRCTVSVNLETTKKIILASMNSNPQTLDTIADATDLTRSTVQRAIIVLLQTGAIETVGKGVRGAPRTYRKNVISGPENIP